MGRFLSATIISVIVFSAGMALWWWAHSVHTVVVNSLVFMQKERELRHEVLRRNMLIDAELHEHRVRRNMLLEDDEALVKSEVARLKAFNEQVEAHWRSEEAHQDAVRLRAEAARTRFANEKLEAEIKNAELLSKRNKLRKELLGTE